MHKYGPYRYLRCDHMGKSFDLMLFANTANRAALTAVPMVVGETFFVATVAPVGVYVKDDGYVAAVMVVSETAAAVDVRFHQTKDPSWNNPTNIPRLQTVQPTPKNFQPVGYPIIPGQVLSVEIMNAGAVLDSVAMFIDKGAGIASPIQPAGVPQGYMLVDALATMTMVADQLVTGTVVFENFVIDPLKKYHIAGMAACAATGHFTRLKYLEGENKDDHPGVPTSDTSPGLDHMMFYGDFGTFNGLNGIQVEQLSEDADATVCLSFLIKEL